VPTSRRKRMKCPICGDQIKEQSIKYYDEHGRCVHMECLQEQMDADVAHDEDMDLMGY